MTSDISHQKSHPCITHDNVISSSRPLISFFTNHIASNLISRFKLSSLITILKPWLEVIFLLNYSSLVMPTWMSFIAKECPLRNVALAAPRWSLFLLKLMAHRRYQISLIYLLVNFLINICCLIDHWIKYKRKTNFLTIKCIKIIFYF